MRATSLAPGYTHEFRCHGGVRKIGHVIHCDACAGTDVVFATKSNPVLPPEALAQMFRRKGWRVHSRGKHVCPACIEKEKQMSEKPREMQPKDRRTIFAKLMECYDEVNSRYCDDFTDHSIAKELAVPRKWVEDIREENFGPAGRNVEMDRVAGAIGEFAAKCKALTDDAMSIAARGETLAKEAETLRSRLDGLERAVGPRAVRA